MKRIAYENFVPAITEVLELPPPHGRIRVLSFAEENGDVHEFAMPEEICERLGADMQGKKGGLVTATAADMPPTPPMH